MTFEHLFTPIQIGKMRVKNRIGLPPMTVGYGTADATLTDRHRAYYEARAKGGAGLIVTEAAAINGNRKYGLFPLGLYEDTQIPSWAKLAEAVHPYGTKVGVQLMDPGPESIQMLTGIQPVGPSAVVGRSHFRSLPREMTTGEVEAVVEDFAEAVGRAREAGLDCVQIHAAHGYAMVGSFLSPFFNKRTDRYGGSLEGRLQFLLEIIAATRAKVGPDFPIMLRMSGDERRTGGRTLQETQFIARTRFDVLMAGAMLVYLAVFAVLYLGLDGTPETVIIRGFGSMAFLMLSFVLCIGPLSRYSETFKRLVYNRRHLGVATFFVGLIHGLMALMQFFEGDIVGVFTTNTNFGDLTRFPFAPFGVLALVILAVMASTSHDHWFHKFGILRWKKLHMLVYVAYVSLVVHVSFGFLQDQSNPVLWIGFAAVVGTVFVLHVMAALKERMLDSAVGDELDGFVYACRLGEIHENEAKAICIGDERVAVVHFEGAAYAMTNVCKHQNGPLGEGRVVNGYLECPWHGYQFSPKDGTGPPPYCDKVPTHDVRMDGDKIYVKLEANKIEV